MKPRKPKREEDKRIHRITELWAAEWNRRHEQKYPWDLPLPGKQSQDRAAALRCIAVARIPEHDGADRYERLSSAMGRYLDSAEQWREKGLTDAAPTLARFGRDLQRWLGQAESAGADLSNVVVLR